MDFIFSNESNLPFQASVPDEIRFGWNKLLGKSERICEERIILGSGPIPGLTREDAVREVSYYALPGAVWDLTDPIILYEEEAEEMLLLSPIMMGIYLKEYDAVRALIRKGCPIFGDTVISPEVIVNPVYSGQRTNIAGKLVWNYTRQIYLDDYLIFDPDIPEDILALLSVNENAADMAFSAALSNRIDMDRPEQMVNRLLSLWRLSGFRQSWNAFLSDYYSSYVMDSDLYLGEDGELKHKKTVANTKSKLLLQLHMIRQLVENKDPDGALKLLEAPVFVCMEIPQYRHVTLNKTLEEQVELFINQRLCLSELLRDYPKLQERVWMEQLRELIFFSEFVIDEKASGHVRKLVERFRVAIRKDIGERKVRNWYSKTAEYLLGLKTKDPQYFYYEEYSLFLELEAVTGLSCHEMNATIPFYTCIKLFLGELFGVWNLTQVDEEDEDYDEDFCRNCMQQYQKKLALMENILYQMPVIKEHSRASAARDDILEEIAEYLILLDRENLILLALEKNMIGEKLVDHMIGYALKEKKLKTIPLLMASKK